MALLLLLPSRAAGQDPDAADPCAGSSGPLVVLNEALLRQPFFRGRPTGACPAGAPVVELRAAVANQFVDLRNGNRWALLDAETYRIETSLGLPMGPATELRIELPYYVRAEGVLDGPIEAFHGFLGLPRGTRPDHPRNRVRLLLGTDGVQPELALSETGPAATFGDPTLSVLHRLRGRSGRLAVAARAGVKLPFHGSGQLLASGALDLALGAAVTARLAGRLWSHASLDLVLLGDSPLERGDLRLADTMSQLLLGIEWRTGASTRLLLQARRESAPLRVGIGNLDRTGLLVAVGARRRLGRDLELEGALAEDLQVETAPDLTLQAGLRWSPQ